MLPIAYLQVQEAQWNRDAQAVQKTKAKMVKMLHLTCKQQVSASFNKDTKKKVFPRRQHKAFL